MVRTSSFLPCTFYSYGKLKDPENEVLMLMMMLLIVLTGLLYDGRQPLGLADTLRELERRA